MHPSLQRLGSLDLGSVDADVGPFVEQGAVEAFDLAVGLGSVGPSEGVGDAVEALMKDVASIAGTVVGPDPFDTDAVLCEPCLGSGPETGGGDAELVGVDLGVRGAAVTIDRSVDEGVTNTSPSGQ